MKAEKMVMLTGKQYQEVKKELDKQSPFKYNVGTNVKPELLNITDIYLDTDPEFTRNPKQYAAISNDNYVQVRVEYEE
jgi:heat shock protein HspQ